MPDESTVQRIYFAPPATVAGNAQTAPPPEFEFGDVLASLIQVGRIEGLERPDREVVVAEVRKPVREAVEGANSLRFTNRERTEIDDASEMDGSEHVSAKVSRETQPDREGNVVEKPTDTGGQARTQVNLGGDTGAVKLNLEGELLKNAPEMLVKKEAGIPLATDTLDTGSTKLQGLDLTAKVQVVTEQVAAEYAPVENKESVNFMNIAALQSAAMQAKGAPAASQGDLNGELGRGNSQSSIDRVDAPGAKSLTGGVFGRLLATEKEAGASQEAMIERIMQFTKNRGPRSAANIRMTLTPARLGTVQMDICIREGMLSVICRTENPASRAILMGGIDDLRAALEGEGLSLSGFDVSVDRGDTGESQKNFYNSSAALSRESVNERTERKVAVFAASLEPTLVDLTA